MSLWGEMRVFTSIRGPVHANGPALKSRFSPAISLPSFFFFFCPPCFVPVFRVPSGGTSRGLRDKKREEPGRAVLIAVIPGTHLGVVRPRSVKSLSLQREAERLKQELHCRPRLSGRVILKAV